MQILLYARNTGKTRACREALTKQTDTYLIVMDKQFKTFFKPELRDRIKSYLELMNTPLPKGTKLIIDEPDYMPYLLLKGMEETYDIVLVTGTPNPHTKMSWFHEMVLNYPECVEKKTWLDIGEKGLTLIKKIRPMQGEEAFKSQGMAEFTNNLLT